MSFTTKGIDTTPKKELGPDKNLGLGNHVARIFNMELRTMPYNAEQMELVLTLVGNPTEPNFEGWPIDQDNPSKGTFPGPMTRVSTSPFKFESRTLSDGTYIDRDAQIMKTIAIIADELNVRSQLDEVDAETLQEYVQAASHIFKASKTKLNVLIGGSKYLNKEGKLRTNYSFPYLKKGRAFQSVDAEQNIVPAYDESTHLYIPEKVKASLVNEQSQPQATASSTEDDDFVW
jgi:hypothetical protein